MRTEVHGVPLGYSQTEAGAVEAATNFTVVMASKGYPGRYAAGAAIEGLEEAAAVEGVEIFHAGTARRDGATVAAGGRVLNVSALGRSVREARERAYAAVDRIRWPGGFCRRDIGWRAVERERAS